jgi:hypothetical protein
MLLKSDDGLLAIAFAVPTSIVACIAPKQSGSSYCLALEVFLPFTQHILIIIDLELDATIDKLIISIVVLEEAAIARSNLAPSLHLVRSNLELASRF